jgi:putative chitinase
LIPAWSNLAPRTVLALQRQLRRVGYSPGPADGIDGPRTRAALRAFQGAAGLVVDGIAGPATWAALERASTASPVAPPAQSPACMAAISVEIVCKMFPHSAAPHIAANLPGVLYALQAAQLTTLPLVVFALATILVETGTFQPVEEAVSKENTSHGGQPFDKYDNNAILGNKGSPDGRLFCGRGYVQLTGRSNYTQFGPLVGLPELVLDPHDATDPDTAASLLAAFIKSRKDKVEKALAANDLRHVRSLVNGGVDGLDRFEDAYCTGMRLLSPAALG